jgi:hypothetical protein
MKTVCRQAALALVLVLAQTGLMLHALDVDAHRGNPDTCSLCLLGHSLEHSLPGDIPIPVVAGAIADAAITPPRHLAVRYCGERRARAPPRLFLPG